MVVSQLTLHIHIDTITNQSARHQRQKWTEEEDWMSRLQPTPHALQ